MRRWIDELSFRARVVLTILIVAITITIAVISWDDIGNWKAAFEAAGAIPERFHPAGKPVEQKFSGT